MDMDVHKSRNQEVTITIHNLCPQIRRRNLRSDSDNSALEGQQIPGLTSPTRRKDESGIAEEKIAHDEGIKGFTGMKGMQGMGTQ
jgi:hypothetical protein